jgi:2,3-bisphosphoglycerate-independent phosphoglycerate mutase
MTTKYAIIIPDGAADDPIEQLGNKTALEAADKPNMDKISRAGRLGLVHTVPEGMPPGSDVAQMSLLGYDPEKYYTGRAPIEAVARNIQLAPDDWVFRCNLVTFADGKIADHSAGHISTEEAAQFIKELNEHLANDKVRFYTGVSYRHLLVLKGFNLDVRTCPPHDNIGQPVDKILPRGKGADFLTDLIARSQQFFYNHDINKIKADLGENQVSSIWLWGEGKKAALVSFKKKYGIKGAAITAVDLVRGLAKLIGFDLIEVPGATGFIDTNFKGKGQAAIKALDDYDLVFVHVEAPDEASHNGNPELKKKAIEQIDKFVVGPLYEAIQQYKSWRIMVLPDHPTLIKTAAHCGDPVPFAMAGSNVDSIFAASFNEPNARKSGLKIENGFELMEYFLKS